MYLLYQKFLLKSNILVFPYVNQHHYLDFLKNLVGMPRFELRPLLSKSSMLPNYIHIPILNDFV